MRLDEAIAKVRARLASLDTERAEPEAPLWAAALQAEFPIPAPPCPYCNREHDSRIACPEYAHWALRSEAVHVRPVSQEISASARNDLPDWPVFEGELHYDPVQECGHTTRAALRQMASCMHCNREHDSRVGCREYMERQQPTETVDHSDVLPDDAQLSLEAFNAKIDAVLEDVAQWHRRVEKEHG